MRRVADDTSERARARADARSGRRRFTVEIDHEDADLVPDLLDQSFVLNHRANLGSPPTLALVAVSMWPATAPSALAGWAAGTLITSVTQVMLVRAYGRRSPHDSPLVWRRRLTVTLALGGTLWGTLPWWTLPSIEDRAYEALLALFVLATMAATTVFTSPLRRMFVAFQLPLAIVSAAGFVVMGSGFSVVMAALILYALVFSFVLYVQANRNAVATARLACDNRVLVEELQAERFRIEAANLELRDVNALLRHQAAHDALTDLANRQRFRDLLDEALTAARADGTVVAVAFIDLDRFKKVNDSLGHHVGDDLLVAVARRVRSVLRPTDVLGRQGGDEFTLLLTGLDDASDAVAIGESICAVLRRPFDLNTAGSRRDVTVTSSIGIAVGPHGADTADDLMRHADAAMYRSKGHGRDRVELFDESMRVALTRRLDDEAELRRAFANREIVSWLQPEVDLHTGRIVGAECLARWVHPERGVLSAGAFVPLVEDAGLLFDLSRVIAGSGLVARAALVDVVDPTFRVRINVSASQLSDIGLLYAFLSHLDSQGLPPSAVHLEVTETAVISDLNVARTWLETAREVGITVSLDDFGTGYSSLALLAQLPLDGVKIDLGFVRDMVHSPAARAVVAATVELADGLGLHVVAEGVETEEQAEALRQAGVHRAQGFLYAPAVPLDTLRDWVMVGAPWQREQARADA